MIYITLCRNFRILLKVQEAIAALKSRGEPISQRAIAPEVGLSIPTLIAYPGIVELLEEAAQEERFERRQQEWFLKFERAIASLRSKGEPLLQEKIIAEAGTSLPTLMRYPRVTQLVREVVQAHKEERLSRR